jgi:hypothetical protein
VRPEPAPAVIGATDANILGKTKAFEKSDTRSFLGKRSAGVGWACLNARPVACAVCAYVSSCPPSTTTVWPVIQLAYGLARKSTTPATSSGVPSRPNGTECSIC